MSYYKKLCNAARMPQTPEGRCHQLLELVGITFDRIGIPHGAWYVLPPRHRREALGAWYVGDFLFCDTGVQCMVALDVGFPLPIAVIGSWVRPPMVLSVGRFTYEHGADVAAIDEQLKAAVMEAASQP